MEKLTEKQLRTRWGDVKKQIRDRPLLAYRVGIPLDKWDEYMHSVPSENEINRIYNEIQNDRIRKTLRLKDGLSQIVGYRESKEYARKSGVSDTSIRDIVEGKKEMAGYDVINRLEIFMHAIMPEFEISLENPLTIKEHTYEYIGEIISQIDCVADSLKRYCYRLSEYSRKGEKTKDWQGNDIEPTAHLQSDIDRLIDLKLQVNNFCEIYMKK